MALGRETLSLVQVDTVSLLLKYPSLSSLLIKSTSDCQQFQ